MVSFPVILEKDPDQGYVIYCPVSQGDTFEEALENIKEAIELCLEVMVDQGEEIPGREAYVVSFVDVQMPLAPRKGEDGSL